MLFVIDDVPFFVCWTGLGWTVKKMEGRRRSGEGRGGNQDVWVSESDAEFAVFRLSYTVSMKT